MDLSNVPNEIERLFLEVYRERVKAETEAEEEYWQGVKDGIRKCIVILAEAGMLFNIDAELGLETSPNSRLTENETILALLNDFVYQASALLYEVEYEDKTDVRTRTGVRNAVRWYDRLAQEGLVPKISNHC